MERSIISEKIIDALCRDYQVLWLIDAETLSIHYFTENPDTRYPDSVETVKALKSYENARVWYIEHCISENDKKRLLQLTSPANIIEHTAGGATYTVEYNRVMNGVVNYNQLVYTGIESAHSHKQYILLGFRDIDVRRQVEIDSLTGLYTRHAFFRKAELLLKANPAAEYVILITDILDFKKLNEVYGISRADEILRWLGAFFAPYIGAEVLIARYGGDQFVLMAPQKMFSQKDRMMYINALTAALKESNLPPLTLKFGIYENIPHDKSIVSICDNTHVALNRVKKFYGQDVAYYDDSFRHELEIKRRIEDCMYESLKNGEFKVYYQPKHEAGTNRLVGAEALVRWIHPEYGFMSPADFIPLFEANGFVVEVDSYVLKRTCSNLKRWEDRGIRTVPVSVNASKLTLEQNEILEWIQQAVQENAINPDRIHLEVTETLMSNDSNALIEKLHAIKAMGHEIELDDFGTGYSSINILSTLPLDVVKLDMSFMQHFREEKKKKILAACIALAKDLGYKTVSEGVEEQEQIDELAKYGVDFIQGYYYSKPLPEDEFEAYMQAHQ